MYATILLGEKTQLAYYLENMKIIKHGVFLILQIHRLMGSKECIQLKLN